MKIHRLSLILAGAFASGVIAFGSVMAHGPRFISGLERESRAALAHAGAVGVEAQFRSGPGWLSRHAVLTGGLTLDPALRRKAAQGVDAIPGVGGVRWSEVPGGRLSDASSGSARTPLHCQEDVESILKARSIRFTEASAAIDPASTAVLDEVAEALRPCLGSQIAITGHTDAAGAELANVRLSRQRAEAVRQALAARGIPGDGLRAMGVGSREPVHGLDPADPANRRIEFSVISIAPLQPTPVDTPGAG